MDRTSTVQISIHSPLEYCPDHASSKGCSNRHCKKLHVCKFFILETCDRKDCSFGHKLDDDHNKNVLAAAGYKPYEVDDIKKTLLRKRCPLLIPTPCSNIGCSKESCPFLHICRFYLESRCNKGSQCAYSHDILSDRSVDILRRYGFNLNRSMEAILEDVQHVTRNGTSLHADPGDPEEMAERQQQLDRRACGICINFLQRKCKSTSCKFLHFKRPYLWEVISADGTQRCFLPRKSWKIDSYFRQPAVDEITIRWNGGTAILNFDACDRNKFELRDVKSDATGFRASFVPKYLVRWSTPSWKKIPQSSWSMRWDWYCKGETSAWIRFGAPDHRRYVSNATSNFLEKKFLKKEVPSVSYDNANSSFRWKVTLSFSDMTQTNHVTGKKRPVRRRPAPGSDATIKPESKAIKGGSDVVRIEVTVSSAKYSEIVRPFQSAGLSVTKVEEIRNRRLYRNFMEEKQAWRNNGKTETNEQLLYHGTAPLVVDAVCKRNFDWRRAGSSVGHVYGRGSYFAKDPRVSVSYCSADSNGCKYIIAAQVLVGKSTIGTSQYTLPPPIGSDDLVRYDSCVDDVQNPTKFVIFHESQLFPNYVITLN